MDNNRIFTWRIWVAVILTSLGVFYYLFFLFFLAGGVPIEKIHYRMTDGWPAFCADNVPLVAPLFLFLGLYFWYSHTVKSRPKPVIEPDYAFEFKLVDKNAEAVIEGTEPELESKPEAGLQAEPKLEAKSQLKPEPETEPLPDHYVFGKVTNKSTT